MPIIPFHLLPMEFYVPRLLPSLPRHLFFIMVLAYCASLLPCSVYSDSNYEICKKTSTCGNVTLGYPFGVGNNGCGLSDFPIDCVQNSSAIIAIDGLDYTILDYYPNNNSFSIVRNENCEFLEDQFNIGSAFQIRDTSNWTLYVYKCYNTVLANLLQYTGGKLISECNTTVYYSFNKFDLSLLLGCTALEPVTVDVGIVEWLSTTASSVRSCASCHTTGGICGYNSSASFLCYCENGVHTDNCIASGVNKSRKKAPIGAAIGGSVGAVVLIAAAFFIGKIVYRRRKKDCFRESLVVSSVKDEGEKEMEAGIQGKIGTLTIFSNELLKRATNDFDEKNQLGDGGFGSVYLGKLPDGRNVAVKRLHQDNSRRVQQFINEVQILSSFCHPNLVSLYGCTSPDSRDLLLVYEYVENGTLADHLHGERKKDKGLNWDTRLKICIETAQALAFLHSLDSPIYHRDVKSTNILLDKHFRVKVADFGLSRFVPLDATHISTAPQGTPGYLDPEYHQCFQLTDKSDVYSFGVVLMEIISGKIAVDTNRTRREIVLATMAIAKVQAGSLDELVDPKLDIEGNPHIKVMASAVAETAFRCLAPEKEDRPNMKEVVAQLEQIRENGGKWKNPVFHPQSPTSVQEKWVSTTTTAENSASSV